MQRLSPIICPYICKIRAFFIDLKHPAGGNGPSGAGFVAKCRHRITEWPRHSRMMRERPAPRLQAGNDAKCDTWTTQDRYMKRRPDKLRRNGRKNDSRVSCTGGFAHAQTHTGSAIQPSVTDARLHSRGFHLRGGKGALGALGGNSTHHTRKREPLRRSPLSGGKTCRPFPLSLRGWKPPQLGPPAPCLYQ